MAGTCADPSKSLKLLFCGRSTRLPQGHDRRNRYSYKSLGVERKLDGSHGSWRSAPLFIAASFLCACHPHRLGQPSQQYEAASTRWPYSQTRSGYLNFHSCRVLPRWKNACLEYHRGRCAGLGRDGPKHAAAASARVFSFWRPGPLSSRDGADGEGLAGQGCASGTEQRPGYEGAVGRTANAGSVQRERQRLASPAACSCIR